MPSSGRSSEDKRFFENRTIAKKYLVTYPDRSRKYVDRETRDQLILSQDIVKSGVDRYRYTGEVRTFHSFRDLENLYVPQRTSDLRRFLAGSFIFLLRGHRQRELMETPEGMAIRLAGS